MRKITGNKKGIDTILAALLMVVIVVVAAVMVYAWSTGLLGTLLVHPTTGQENLSLENCTPTCSFSSTQNATLSLRNIGTANITLATYFVKDSNGNQYARSAWNTAGPNQSPTISPNAAKPVYILINTACGSSCSLTGSAFQYTSGYSYTVTVTTTRNNQFTFTVTR